MQNMSQELAKSRNFSLAFDKMCNFVAIAETRDVDSTVDEIVLQSFMILSNELISNAKQLMDSIDALFGLEIPESWLEKSLDRLIENKKIQLSANSVYVLESSTQKILKDRVDESIKLEERVKYQWFSEIILKYPEIDNELIWKTLKNYLSRAFRRHGIQTAALLDPSVDIAPEYSESLTYLVNDAIKEFFQRESFSKAREAISMFLAMVGKYPDRIKYIAQLADGAFNYFSITVSPQIANNFRQKLIPLTLFLDTNFLFGVLDLHVNPQIDTSLDLLKSSEKYNFPFSFMYHKATNSEMKSTIEYYYQRLKTDKWNRNLSRAAIKSRCLSGIEAKFHEMNAEKGVDVKTFFNFYQHIDVLLNDKKIILAENDDKSDEDVELLILEYNKFLREWGKSKPQKLIEHDMTVLHAVRKLRSESSSSIEAKVLFMTCDYILYRFDWESSRHNNKLPSVVLPNIFWQILRPFIPSTHDFEKTFAETFAIPEFRTISSETSKACSKLVCMLNLYQDMNEETAMRLLSNDMLINGLRNIENDEEIQEFVDSAIARDNELLLEEKAMVERELEDERAKSVLIAKELEAERENIKKVKESSSKVQSKIQETVRDSTERIVSLQKEIQEIKQDKINANLKETEFRDKYERQKKININFITIFVPSILILAFEIFVYKLPWAWLINHKQSYSLQGLFDLILFTCIATIINKRWRKTIVPIGFIGAAILLFLQLLGGPE